MCWRCVTNQDSQLSDAPLAALQGVSSRRHFLNRWGTGLGFSALVHTAAQAQVDVGQSSSLRKLVPAESLEESAKLQYRQTLGEASSKGALAPDDYPQLKRLRAICKPPDSVHRAVEPQLTQVEMGSQFDWQQTAQRVVHARRQNCFLHGHFGPIAIDR